MQKIENAKLHLLVIDDEEGMRSSLFELLSQQGFKVSTAESARKALSILQQKKIDLIVCDVVMPDMGGLIFLSKINLKNFPVIMITAHASIETARRAFKAGAYDYLVKPFDFSELLAVINQCFYAYGIRKVSQRSSLYLSSQNAQFLEMLETAKIFSLTDMPILIVGESGTGKEVISDYIVEHSSRSDKQYSKINCAAIPEPLLESEMFGHEKGSFTGAQERKIGKFEEANNGTILFDEIGDMDISLQAKLLRVLQDFTFSRVGGRRKISVDCRIISATNKEFDTMIGRNQFRDDLYHRLNGATLKIPPLRNRKEDIEDLAQYFLLFYAEKYRKNVSGFSDEGMHIIKQYDWPGNIREMKNCLERAIVVANNALIQPQDLPDSVFKKSDQTVMQKSHDFSAEVKDYHNQYSRKMLLDVLNKVEGNKSEAAKILGVSRKTFYKWLQACDIKNEYK